MIKAMYDFGLWPKWCPAPLKPDHLKRLDGWARTLPGTIHAPWRKEGLAHMAAGGRAGGTSYSKAARERRGRT